MPVLKDGKQHSVYNGRVVDKESEDAVFFDDTHEYFYKPTGEKGISVTQLISAYEQPFDSSFWASYKAMEALLDMETWLPLKRTLLARKKFDERIVEKLGVDRTEFENKKAEILKLYEDKKNKSCERGTAIHAIYEQALYKKDPSIKKYGFGGHLDVFEGEYSRKLCDGVYPEYMIAYRDDDICLVGQIDLLVIENGRIKVIDHKSNEKLEFKSYYNPITKSSIKMKPPLQHLDDISGQHYTIQLSLYAWMVQQIHPEYEVEKLTIHWIDHDNNEKFIDVPYLKDDVEHMIAHYKKQKKIQAELDRDKPFII